MSSNQTESITIKEAASRLGVDQETLRVGLRNSTFPVGCAVKSVTGRYTYIIPRAAFENWMKTGNTPNEIYVRIDAYARHAIRAAIKEVQNM